MMVASSDCDDVQLYTTTRRIEHPKSNSGEQLYATTSVPFQMNSLCSKRDLLIGIILSFCGNIIRHSKYIPDCINGGKKLSEEDAERLRKLI